MKPENQRYFAELIGTFALVFVGAGSVIADYLTGGAVGLLGIALAHGLILMAMIYALGNTSGAHFNPAVTTAFVFAGKMKPKTGAYYILFQLLGSLIAGFALLALFPFAPSPIHLGSPALNADLGVKFAIGTLIEIILTFFLVFVVFAVAMDKRNSTPMIGLAIGFTLALGILVGGGFTGAALNPARAFGPAIVSQFFTNQLVYWIGPIVGGLAAASLYTNAFMPRQQKTLPQKKK